MYRIGELAVRAGVSKRTIDYYTSIGLLNAERTRSNYRLYDDEALSDLKYIEECKSMHFPLEEIRRKLEIKKAGIIRESEVCEQAYSVAQQMKQLQDDLTALLPLIRKLDAQKRDSVSRNLNQECSALLQSLKELTS
ncbi:MerR family transcriptional regulator [Neobacillus notoginsengisoli]|uniref:MerR family transcriptional regulator n=1 Tax=Neobacillus notoginsengisoli TaxID=1578198 RepID=A0A417YLC9_9BACI|nr:MerR family transcriptional regulator [Neobacillus notoginsengisoli]